MTATISTDTKKINYKSDFDFIAKLIVADADGTTRDLGFPDFDWEMRMSTGCNGYTTFVASSIGGKLTNCINDGGQLRIVCNNHGLRAGVLYAEFHAHLPNAIYPDGDQLVVTYQGLGIELVLRDGESDTSIETELQLPIVAVGEGGSPDMTRYLLKTDAERIYAKKAEIPKVPTKVSELDNDKEYITIDDVPQVELPDNLATTDDLAKKQDTLVSGKNIKTINGQSILGEGDIAIVGGGEGSNIDLSGYLTKDNAEQTYAKKTDIPNVPTKVGELQNDKGYITLNEVPKTDLSDYATKEQLNGYQPKGDYATTTQLNGKQDKLTSGEGISIENNVISCTLDTSLYVVVSELPEIGVANKIYLIESNTQGEQNIYTEYAYVNNTWERLGEYRAEIDLAPYLTKADAESTYQPKGDYALASELPTKVSELENDADYVDAETLQEKIDSIDVGVQTVKIVGEKVGTIDLGNEVKLLGNEFYAYDDGAGHLTEIADGEVYFSTVSRKDSATGDEVEKYIVGKVKGFNVSSSTSEKEILMMKAYLFDFSGTYTQAQIESSFKVTFDELIAAIKNGNAIVITSSGDTSGNYNIVFGATYTLLDDAKTLSTLSMMWWQYSQWVTLSLTYNASSDNYTVAVTKTA